MLKLKKNNKDLDIQLKFLIMNKKHTIDTAHKMKE